jgi:hypothetical protein
MERCKICGGDVPLARNLLVRVDDKWVTGHEECVSLLIKSIEIKENKDNDSTKKVIDVLTKALEPTIVPFDYEDIDNFILKGNKIENTMIVTSFPEMDNCHYVMTKYGAISVSYSMYLPEKMMILVNKVNWKG